MLNQSGPGFSLRSFLQGRFGVRASGQRVEILMRAAMRNGNRTCLLEPMHLTQTFAAFATPLIKRRAHLNALMMHALLLLVLPAIIIFFMRGAPLLDRLLELADADLGQAQYFLHIRKN